MILRAGAIALRLGIQMPLLVFLSLWSRYAWRPAAERGGGLALSLSFASEFAFIYLLNRTTDAVEDEANGALDPAVPRAARGLLVAAWFCLLAPLPWLALGQKWAALGVYAFVAFWGYAYSRAIPSLGLKRRLKDRFFLKTFTTSGLGWAPAIVYGPMAFDGSLAPGHCLAYVRVTMLIFAISACWDIRDVSGDASAGVRTLPVALGIPATKWICAVLMAAFAFTDPARASAGRLAAEIATVAWIALSGTGRGQNYYYWGIFFWIFERLWGLSQAA